MNRRRHNGNHLGKLAGSLALSMLISEAGHSEISQKCVPSPPRSLDKQRVYLSENYQERKDNVEMVHAYRVPAILADTIAMHVAAIFEAGFAQELSLDDFFHGHFYVAKGECRGPPHRSDRLPSTMNLDKWLETYLDSDPFFVYHTMEHTAHECPFKGSPRSLLGMTDGTIYAFSSKSDDYRDYGTVYGHESFTVRGEWKPGMCRAGFKAVFPSGTLLSGQKINVRGFYILPNKEGRYALSDGQHFEVVFHGFLWD